MSGHSKWANIKFRKERVDSKKGKAFSKVVKEITVAAREGGGDPAGNPRLRLALQKGKEVNLPGDNVEKAIKRGTGQLDGANYEEIRYEGYGPAGVAVIVDSLTDNRNRTSSELRRIFSTSGGNLGTGGSVSYLFERVCQLLFAPGHNTDALALAAIDNGARDYVVEDDGSVEVTALPEKLHDMKNALSEAGFQPATAEIVMRTDNFAPVSGDVAEKVRKLVDRLEDNDDVQQVHINAFFESD